MRHHSNGLSRPNTKKGRGQRVVLQLLREHEDDPDGLPTNGRFVFYELEQRGLATKPSPDDTRRHRRRSIGWPPGGQGHHRLPDEHSRDRHHSLGVDRGREPPPERVELRGDSRRLRARPTREATINPWGDAPPPLILCESKATAGVLEAIVGNYVCPISGTGGQVGGFLRTVIAPILEGNDRRVLYLGDLDRHGNDIERNTRRVLEEASGREIDWQRLGITEEQIAERGIEPIWKVDGRDRRADWAWEVESLGQASVIALVRAALDALLPEPLQRVQEREQHERGELVMFLEGRNG